VIREEYTRRRGKAKTNPLMRVRSRTVSTLVEAYDSRPPEANLREAARCREASGAQFVA
jgi:ribosomal protein S12